MIRAILLLLGMLLVATPAAAQRCNQDCALGLVRRGAIQPLERIVGAVERTAGGRLIGAELFRDGDRWTYRLRFLRGGNQVGEIFVDAASGSILSRRGTTRRRRFR